MAPYCSAAWRPGSLRNRAITGRPRPPDSSHFHSDEAHILRARACASLISLPGIIRSPRTIRRSLRKEICNARPATRVRCRSDCLRCILPVWRGSHRIRPGSCRAFAGPALATAFAPGRADLHRHGPQQSCAICKNGSACSFRGIALSRRPRDSRCYLRRDLDHPRMGWSQVPASCHASRRPSSPLLISAQPSRPDQPDRRRAGPDSAGFDRWKCRRWAVSRRRSRKLPHIGRTT